MSTVWIISTAGLWLAVILLTVLVLLLYRQFGLAYMSGRARAGMQGLDLGSRARPVALTALDGSDVEIDWSPSLTRGGATVLVFALPSCPICGDLARDAASLPAAWPASRFVWVDGTSAGRPARAVDGAPGWIVGMAEGDAVHQAWDVSGAPFAYVVAASGRVAAKGVVNRAADVDRLLANVLGAGHESRRMIELVPDDVPGGLS
jgi:hypothetical protein